MGGLPHLTVHQDVRYILESEPFRNVRSARYTTKKVIDSFLCPSVIAVAGLIAIIVAYQATIR